MPVDEVASGSGVAPSVNHDFVSLDVQPYGADGPVVGGVQVWNVLGASLDLTDTVKLIFSFLISDPVIKDIK